MMTYHLTEYNFWSGDKSVVELDDPVKNKYADSRYTTSEGIAKTIYEESGYKAMKLDPGNVPIGAANDSGGEAEKAIHEKILDHLKEHVGDELMNYMPVLEIDNAGIPDFLVYKWDGESITDWYFSEVKSEDDGLSRSQVEWFTEYHYFPIKVTYVDS